ncbi:hypothetical protein FHW96_004489 [Novosphingobium sp. SG751A]|uniref:acetylxylan esterase n=1 Tax=Novosphingobium sp. SG751A TaxID=2587000 RepID=UPI001554AEA4|nr:acetylxylan esterase [Novosphingobium sp. SG751A]NOW48301.1 hypothetical protein [Novosphingobium sp. SG751A]
MKRISCAAAFAASLLLAPLCARAAPVSASLAPYFAPVTTPSASPDQDGFLRRWLVLEPIAKPNRSNQGFTSVYVRDAFAKAALPGGPTAIPRDGQTIPMGGQSLQWHALDAGLFDAKLFYLAQGLGKPTYGVIFWATTIIESDREIADAHLAVGSNSASMWWLNGAETAALFGDRRMVVDDAVSPRVTLHKGRNILRGAIINGPGLSDFCARFVDDAGRPITDLRIATR